MEIYYISVGFRIKFERLEKIYTLGLVRIFVIFTKKRGVKVQERFHGNEPVEIESKLVVITFIKFETYMSKGVPTILISKEYVKMDIYAWVH